jgi:alpha-tubulin suppressor-like RCC1 family protein
MNHLPRAFGIAAAAAAIVTFSFVPSGVGGASQRIHAVTPHVLGGVTQISAGGFHTCALLTAGGGTVKCWGKGTSGQLGNGANVNAKLPVSVVGLADVTQISAGEYHTCAVLTSAQVECWGQGTLGQLGNGANANSNVPVVVSGLAGVTQVSAGGFHTCALLTNRQVKCWGLGTSGQLGDNTFTSSNVPVAVASMTNAVQISTGGFHTCALLATRHIKCWGLGTSGQLGNNTYANKRVPTLVVGLLSTTIQVSTGQYHTCALVATGGGVVECWGLGNFGQLGTGETSRHKLPVAVGAINNATKISAGEYHTCALIATRHVRCWGEGTSGQLGDNAYANSKIQVLVGLIANALQISAGGHHTCALTTTRHNVECWGLGSSGQLGDNAYANHKLPVVVI